MGAIDGFTGWETPYTTVFTGTAGAQRPDWSRARSGRGYFTYYRTSTAGKQVNGPTFNRWNGNLNDATNPNLTIAGGNIGYARTRFYIRGRTLPTTGNLRLFTLDGNQGGFNVSLGVGLTSAGTFRCWAYSGLSTAPFEGADGTLVLPTNTEQWTQVDVQILLFNSATSNKSTIRVVATIQLPSGSTESVSHSRSAFNLASPAGSTVNLTSVRLFGALGYTPTGSTFETPGAYELDADDWICRLTTGIASSMHTDGVGTAAPTMSGSSGDKYIQFPTSATSEIADWTCNGGTSWSQTDTFAWPRVSTAHTRVGFVQAIGAGADGGWTGAHTRALKNAVNTGANPTSQTAAAAGLKTTFTHETLADAIGDGFAAVAAVNLYAQSTTAAGLDRQKFVLEGAVKEAAGDSLSLITLALLPDSMTHYAEVYATPKTAAQFNAIEWGLESMHASSNTLYGVCAEILHNGPAHSTREQATGGLKVKWVEWTGDGADRKVITGVGFYAHLVKVWSLVTTTTNAPVVKTIDMPGALALASGVEHGDSIERVTSDGFVAGKNLNISGLHYVALCVRDDGDADGGRVFGCGSVLGARAHTFAFAATFPIEIVFANKFSTGASAAFWKTSSIPGTQSFQAGTSSTTGITALDANGLTIGAALGNETEPTFWWGFDLTSPLASRIKHGVVVGQAADAVVSPGSTTDAPYAVMARGSVTTSLATALRFNESEFSGTACTDWDAGPITTSNAIIAIDANARTFTIKGNSTYLDDTPSVIDCYWIAFVETFTLGPPTEVEFQPPIDGGQGAAGLTWVKFTAKDGTNHLWSRVHLPDRAGYEDGFKEGRVLRFHDIKRALSDRLGQHEGTSAGFVLADVDRVLRGLLAHVTNRIIRGRPVVLKSIADVDRRAEKIPRTMFRGVVRSYKALSPLHFELLCEDLFAKRFQTGDQDAQIPKRTIGRTDFIDCPSSVIDTPVPIRYGELIDELSTTAPPQLVAVQSDGSWFDSEGETQVTWRRPVDTVTQAPRTELAPIAGDERPWRGWVMGWGPIAGGPPPPTGIVMTELTGGSLKKGDLLDNRYYCAVTSVDLNGLEGDPHIFNVIVTSNLQIANDNARIQISWTAPTPAPTKYRVYLGNSYYRWNGRQYLEVLHPTTSVIFDKHPPDGQDPTDDTITATAQRVTFAESGFYAVVAVMPDGKKTALSQEAYAKSSPYRRPIRIRWKAVSGAASYLAYRRSAQGTWDRRWSVPASQLADNYHYFDDDLLDTGVTMITEAVGAVGAVPLIFVGMETASDGSRWHRYLVASHAVKEILDVFVDGWRVDPQFYGVYACIPGKAGYSTFFPNTGNPQYRDLNGRRYTIIYGRGPLSEQVARGEKKATANIRGLETAGDGTGTLLTDLLDQYKHTLQNWIVGDYQAGAWLASPTFPDDATLKQIDEPSFDTAKAVGARRVDGGLVGAFSIDGFVSARDLVARFNVSADVESGFNRKSQFFVSMFDEANTVLTAAEEYTQVRDILKGTFGTDDLDSEFFNYVPYVYRRNGRKDSGSEWERSTFVKDDTSIADYEVTKKSPTVEFWMLRSATVASDVAQRRLLRAKDPPRKVWFEAGMRTLNEELGDVITVTHIDGIGATGWSKSPVRITRHEYHPDAFKARLEGWSVATLFSDAFIRGDESVLPATWTSASAAQKVYGYLCDETTGKFSDNERGKRLR